jgi:cellulose synthase/poly-beta-1,6-N-acetylglucosamine synthase-like glycosyltransferase
MQMHFLMHPITWASSVLLLISCLAELWYYLRIFPLSVNSASQSDCKETEDWLPVTVLICLRDELNNLEKLIPAILNQHYPDFQLCLVADRSGQETILILRNFAEENPKIHLIEIEDVPPGISPKKNAIQQGIQAASNPLILLTDADCLPAGPDWIRRMVANFDEQTDVVLGFGGYRQEPGFLNRLIQFDTLCTANQYLGFALRHILYHGVGRNLAYRKELFESNQGFGSRISLLSGDDDLFVNQAARKGRVRCCLNPAGVTLSQPKTTWKEWFRQKARHFSVGKYYRTGNQLWLAGFHLARTSLWISFLFLLFLPFGVLPAILLLSTRFLVILPVLRKNAALLEMKIPTLFLPLLDFLHTIFVFGIGLKARFFPVKEWR